MDFIYEVENILPKEICEAIIKRFHNDSRKSESKIGNGEINHNVRKSTVLFFSEYSDWKDVDNIILDVMTRGVQKYQEYLKTFSNGDEMMIDVIEGRFSNLKDEGYFIQEYKSGDFYKWHIDDAPANGAARSLSVVLYLNTLDESQGGCTEFIGGRKVKPEQGKLVIFPSCGSFIHRGAPVKNSGVKYTIGTWIV